MKISRHFILMAFAVPLVLFVLTVALLGVNVPYWDDYDAILAFANMDTVEQWRNLFAYHNEHRIGLTRLVTMILLWLSGSINFKTFMCVGDCLFLCYVFLLGWRFARSKASIVAYIPAAWLLLDLINYENSIWAMTSVQNQGVLLFAFASIVLLKQGQSNVMLFALSILSAIVATITSGSGLLIWPCLLVEAIWIRVKTGIDKRWLLRTCVITAIGAIVIALYFSSLPEPAVEGLTTFNPLKIAPFGLMFLGGIVPMAVVAVPTGIVLACCLFRVLVHSRKLESIDVAAYLLFLLGSIGAASVCRGGGDVVGALGMRYNVISVSILACIMLLLRETLPDDFKPWKSWVSAVTACAIITSIGIYICGWPLQVLRRDQRLTGMWQYIRTGDGELGYPADNMFRAKNILNESLEKGIYKP